VSATTRSQTKCANTAKTSTNKLLFISAHADLTPAERRTELAAGFLRLHLLDKYQTVTLASAKRDLRVAFSGGKKGKLADLIQYTKRRRSCRPLRDETMTDHGFTRSIRVQ